uniref:TOBE domain-containing protein n=1 Tax=Streptomyces sp. YIM 98790 TaxID=2689077 RepID=UPI001408108F
GSRRPGGPAPGEVWHRALIRVPLGGGAPLAAALKAAQATRLAHGDTVTARVRMDPSDIG